MCDPIIRVLFQSQATLQTTVSKLLSPCDGLCEPTYLATPLDADREARRWTQIFFEDSAEKTIKISGFSVHLRPDFKSVR